MPKEALSCSGRRNTREASRLMNGAADDDPIELSGQGFAQDFGWSLGLKRLARGFRKGVPQELRHWVGALFQAGSEIVKLDKIVDRKGRRDTEFHQVKHNFPKTRTAPNPPFVKEHEGHWAEFLQSQILDARQK